MHRRRLSVASIIVAVGALWLAGCESPADPSGAPVPPAVVLFIGDGMGTGALNAARLSGLELAMETLPVRRDVVTLNALDRVTDSAAAGTALATGFVTYNGAIGVDEDGVPRTTVLEAAEALGWATGLVATSSVTHATPAAFAAHVADRGLENAIAVQMSLSGVDVLLGGGLQYFDGDMRADGLRLTEVFADRGCDVWTEPQQLTTSDAPCVLGLFAAGGLPPAAARDVSLRELTRVALERLSSSERGFFLMVEGSQIDWEGHANDGPGVIAELADFDAALGDALSFLSGRPNTLVVVTADHETGGLTVARDVAGDSIVFDWTTTGHTDLAVPLFASDGEMEQLPDSVRNDALGRLLIEQVRGSRRRTSR